MAEWKKYWDEEIETMPRKSLEALQLRLLKNELAFAYQNSSFYQTSFQETDGDDGGMIMISCVSFNELKPIFPCNCFTPSG